MHVPDQSKSLKKVSLADRLRFGFLTIDEICELRNCCRATFYVDLKRGLVVAEKHGRRTVVRGVEAQRYLKCTLNVAA